MPDEIEMHPEKSNQLDYVKQWLRKNSGRTIEFLERFNVAGISGNSKKMTGIMEVLGDAKKD